MTAAWVCEQTSHNHTETPQLVAGQTSLAPAATAGRTDAALPDASAGAGGEFSKANKPEPAQDASDESNSGLIKIGAGFAAAAALAVGGYLFAWPAISSFFESTPEQVAFVDPDATPTQRYVIDGDTLYLEGTVPNAGVSGSIQDMASNALGEDRVVNNFEIDSSAVYREDAQVPLSVAETVLFSTGRSDVGTQYKDLIDLGVDLMTTQDSVTLTVLGHTDDVGDGALNLDLSVQRAQATADEFVRRGIAADRVSVEGRGETEPIASNDTPEGRSTNRRVEFLIRGLNG